MDNGSLLLRQPGAPIVPGVRRIAVLRANAVGDFIVGLPALAALKLAYPDATLTLLGQHWHAEFLQQRPGPVDEAIALPSIPGLTVATEQVADERAIDGCVAQLRARRFDLALQLHGGGRYSNPFVRRLGARMTAGLRAPDAMALDRELAYLDDHHPVALQLLECVALVGAVQAPLAPRLQLRERDLREADAVLPRSGRPLVLLQPGASHAHKRWAPARFAAVGDVLAARGADVAVHGGPQEGALTQAVCRAMRRPAHDLAGRLSVGGLAGLLSRTRLLVSNDTGPVHLARALEVPTVAIYWVANARSFGPLTTRTQRVATSWRMNCPVCGRNAMTEGCGHEASLVDDVQVEAVLDLAASLWPAAGASPALPPPAPAQQADPLDAL